VTGAGCFAPRIIWISVQGADALQKRIDQALQDLFEPEHRFMGHITIARPRRISEPLRRAVESLDMTVLSAEVPGFSLQISHLSHLGPRYETRARFELGSLRP
jgi:2'-5' RNA ligase